MQGNKRIWFVKCCHWYQYTIPDIVYRIIASQVHTDFYVKLRICISTSSTKCMSGASSNSAVLSPSHSMVWMSRSDWQLLPRPRPSLEEAFATGKRCTYPVGCRQPTTPNHPSANVPTHLHCSYPGKGKRHVQRVMLGISGSYLDSCCIQNLLVRNCSLLVAPDLQS